MRRFIDRVKEQYNHGFVGLFKLYGKQLCDDFMRNPETFSFDKENVLSFDSTDSTNPIGCEIDTLSILSFNTLDKMIELEKTTIFPAVVFDISQMKFVNVSTNLKWKYITEHANEYLRNKNYE